MGHLLSFSWSMTAARRANHGCVVRRNPRPFILWVATRLAILLMLLILVSAIRFSICFFGTRLSIHIHLFSKIWPQAASLTIKHQCVAGNQNQGLTYVYTECLGFRYSGRDIQANFDKALG
ncbi:hypothetical protein BD779DRAFT_1042423 [Infundibulicybe gibba]|nr:hypothetical protein BD779DRAFT_1042423 [Infundibulicybe gibba]